MLSLSNPCLGNSFWLIATAARIYRLDGLKGFWRGVAPRTIYMALGGTLYLGTYSASAEILLKVLGPEAEDFRA